MLLFRDLVSCHCLVPLAAGGSDLDPADGAGAAAAAEASQAAGAAGRSGTTATAAGPATGTGAGASVYTRSVRPSVRQSVSQSLSQAGWLAGWVDQVNLFYDASLAIFCVCVCVCVEAEASSEDETSSAMDDGGVHRVWKGLNGHGSIHGKNRLQSSSGSGSGSFGDHEDLLHSKRASSDAVFADSHLYDTELSRRKAALLFYLVRSPVFDRCVRACVFVCVR